MRNWRPYIPDVIKRCALIGVEEAAVLCLAPHNSRTSVVSIAKQSRPSQRACASTSPRDGAASAPDRSLRRAARVPAFARLSAESGVLPVPVLFTAHSFPSQTIVACEGQAADPYVEETKRTAALVAERVPGNPAMWVRFSEPGRKRRRVDWATWSRRHWRPWRRRRLRTYCFSPSLSSADHVRNSLRRGLFSSAMFAARTESPAGATGVAECLPSLWPGRSRTWRGKGWRGLNSL